MNSFSGATVDDMKDYATLIIKRNPDLLILHYGTNDLNKINRQTKSLVIL